MKYDWKKIWNDSVRNNVIAGIILIVVSQVGILIWGLIKQLNFFEVYDNIFSFLCAEYLIKGQYLTILYLLLLILGSLTLLYPLKNIDYPNTRNKKKGTTNRNGKSPEIKTNEIREAPTVFFHRRFCDAFPGTEYGVTWFHNKKEIQKRLERLLRYPLKFEKANGHGITSDPIWWFRGGSALPIDSFKVLNKGKVLINFDEYVIEKIAAFRGGVYYRDFVYLQFKADKPTGLYKYDNGLLKSYDSNNKEFTEAFAILKRKFCDKLIKKEEYDDGSVIIKGKPHKIKNAELRLRTLTRFNFIITSKFSPYNCRAFEREAENYFVNILNNNIPFEDFIKWMEKFPKSPHDD